MGRAEPKRVRVSVHDGNRHLGYVTVVNYPGRDLTAFAEGSPYHELVITGPDGRHVALLQRFKEHWLIQCGPHYDTADGAADVDDARAVRLARFALSQPAAGGDLAHLLAGKLGS